MNEFKSVIVIICTIIIIWECNSVVSAPAGMMAFFRRTDCPAGWEEYTNARGRLIHSITNSTFVNLTLGTPLSDLTAPSHSHTVTANFTVPSKSISQYFAATTIGATGPTSYTAQFPSVDSGYPFVHMLLCRLINDTMEGVPTGTIAFFDSHTCPDEWNPYSESIGRFIIPGSSENGIVYSTSLPLESQEDRIHIHQYSSAITTLTKKYNLWIAGPTVANPGVYFLTGSVSGTSGFPYVQLLTCRSSEGGSGNDLPLGVHIFFSNGYCNEIEGQRWQDSQSNITGHWIVGLPVNGTVGASYGGAAWSVSATSGRDGKAHTHSYSGSLTLTGARLNLAGGSTSYVSTLSYAFSGISSGNDLDMPYLSVPMCELVGIQSPSPSPMAKKSDAGFKMNTMYTAIIAGVGGLLVLSAVIAAVVIRKRSSKSTMDDEDKTQHYTMVLTAVYTDSTTSVNNIQIKEKLGGGNFGEVFKGVWNGTTLVALKKLKSREQLQEFAQEAKVLLSLNHPNIVRCLGIHTADNGEQYIVMEYLSKGSLDSVLHKEPNIKNGDLLVMALHAAAGMLYLEQQRIVHRDLALRNLLVTHDEGSFTVKVSDFGLSRKIEEGYYMKLDTQGIPIRWTAPEVFEKGIYTSKSDVWSFGITLWELFSFGRIPYEGMTNFEVMQQVVKGYRLDCPVDCPEHIHSLMLRCWQQIPEKRPGFKEIYDVIEAISQEYSKKTLRWSLQTPPPLPPRNHASHQEIYLNNNVNHNEVYF